MSRDNDNFQEQVDAFDELSRVALQLGVNKALELLKAELTKQIEAIATGALAL